MAVEVASAGGAANLQSRSITPSSLPYTVSPQSGYDGMSSVTVNKDSNLISSNIKSNVSIYGVTGTLRSYSYVEYAQLDRIRIEIHASEDILTMFLYPVDDGADVTGFEYINIPPIDISDIKIVLTKDGTAVYDAYSMSVINGEVWLVDFNGKTVRMEDVYISTVSTGGYLDYFSIDFPYGPDSSYFEYYIKRVKGSTMIQLEDTEAQVTFTELRS